MNASTEALPQAHTATVLNKALIIDIALITTIWCVGTLIVNPVGNFPLIDDFSYAGAVRTLVETGDYRPSGWASMTLLSQVLWGALFCLPGGFSFTAVRLSTLVAGLLGLVGTYILVRGLQQPRWLALVITLSLGFYPAYYLLSYTFMTDVPFTAMVIWSVVFLARALRGGSSAHVCAGTVLAIAALLCRQLALAIPAAFAIIGFLRPGLTLRAVVRALVPLIACITALLAFNYWLDATDRAPAIYTSLSDLVLRKLSDIWMPWSLVYTLAIFVYFSPIYLGLFLLPVFLTSWQRLFFSDEMKKLWWTHRKGAAAFALTSTLTMAWGAWFLTRIQYPILLPMPDKGNMLGKPGLGPFTLRDWIILDIERHLELLPTAFWVVLTAMGLVGALLLIAKLSVHAAQLTGKLLRARQALSNTETVSLFLVLCGLIYLPPFLFYGFYDRYLILLIPLFAGSMLGVSGHSSERGLRDEKWPRVIGIALLAAFGVISVSGTRDYLTWNRVRWVALNDLTQNKQVSPAEIDGGPEFNGMHFYDPLYKALPGRSSYWVQGDTYQIGFGVMPGTRLLKEYTYRHWFPPHIQKIVVLRKEDANAPSVAEQ